MRRTDRRIGVVGAAAGSLFVFNGIYRAVLISYRPRRTPRSAKPEYVRRMKQILQTFDTGETDDRRRADARRRTPAPLLIRTTRTA